MFDTSLIKKKVDSDGLYSWRTFVIDESNFTKVWGRIKTLDMRNVINKSFNWYVHYAR